MALEGQSHSGLEVFRQSERPMPCMDSHKDAGRPSIDQIFNVSGTEIVSELETTPVMPFNSEDDHDSKGSRHDKRREKFGWETFEKPDRSASCIDFQDHSARLDQMFTTASTDSASVVESTPVEPFYSEEEEKAKKEKITSMFLANNSSVNEGETTNLHQPSPSSRPPSANRRSSKRPSTAMSRILMEPEEVDGVLLTSIFSIDKISYDVRMFENRITWTPVGLKKSKRPGSSRFKDSARSTSGDGSIFIHEICSVKLKNIRSQKTGSSTTIGFAIFTAEEKNGGKLREKCMFFLCYSREICIRWATVIKQNILARADRPRRLLVLSNGSMSACQAWDDIIEPKLEMACVEGKFVEVDEPDSAGEYVARVLAEQSTNRDNGVYDGLLVVGTHKLFSEVLNAMIDYRDQVLNLGVWNPHIPPIGILPSSTGNTLAKEIHGSSDTETALLHAIFGCTRSIPVCEFSDASGQRLTCGLSASYGFSGGDTARDSPSRVQGTLRKGLAFTKALVKRRSYPCDIQYKVASRPVEEASRKPESCVSGYSVVNQYFLDDDENETYLRGVAEGTSGSDTQDGDSGIWPEFDRMTPVSRENYLDITVTSLSQQDEVQDGAPLSAILLRDSTSRKDLIMGMGSHVSLQSNTGKQKTETQGKHEILHGSEFLIQPVTDQIVNGSSSSSTSHLSSWAVDGCCIDSGVQELHAKVHQIPIVVYGRMPGQAFAMPATPDVLKLDLDMQNLTLDSVV